MKKILILFAMASIMLCACSNSYEDDELPEFPENKITIPQKVSEKVSFFDTTPDVFLGVDGDTIVGLLNPQYFEIDTNDCITGTVRVVNTIAADTVLLPIFEGKIITAYKGVSIVNAAFISKCKDKMCGHIMIKENGEFFHLILSGDSVLKKIASKNGDW